MLSLISKLFARKAPAVRAPSPINQVEIPQHVVADSLAPFPLETHLSRHNGLPVLDWQAVSEWVGKAPSDELSGLAWTACERAWLAHLCGALGDAYGLSESPSAFVVSSLEPRLAQAALDYMGRTLCRVEKVLDGITQASTWGKDILIVFDNADEYYNYISQCYPDEEREFSYSGGMYINLGCSHYVTLQADLLELEPVIVHEMTHACLAHLSLPLWLDEGLAVNTEQHLSNRANSVHSALEMRDKHRSFWGADEIQEFWCGKSFQRPDDGNMLSYDLARIMVQLLSKNWSTFQGFVLHADWRDAGAAAAHEYLGVDLGETVCALLHGSDATNWSPQPGQWDLTRDIQPMM